MSKNKKKTKKNILLIILRLIIYLTLFILSSFKLTAIGIVLNNIFSLIFGSLYHIVFLSLILLSLLKTFKAKITIRLYLSLFILNTFTIILPALYSSNNINSFGLYTEYLKAKINFNLFTSIIESYGAGIIGYIIHIAFSSFTNKMIELIIVLIGELIGLLLLIPHRSYQRLFDDLKEANKLSKEERKIDNNLRKELEKEREIKHEAEIEKYKQEHLKMLEKQAYDGQKELDNQIIETNKKVEQKLNMSSNSPYFLDMTKADSGLDSKEQNDSNNSDDYKPIIIQEIGEKKKTVSKKVGEYRFPPKSLLNPKVNTKSSIVNKRMAEANGKRILEILKQFDISASLVDVHIGPSVTKFEILPNSSIKISKINQYKDNIKMELAATEIRIEAPIPGKRAIGIEIPNVEKTPVMLSELISTFPDKSSEITFALGKGLLGENIYCDISKMPHLLIAGATGSGKSVCINSIITSILMKAHPDEVKLVLVDPKKVEFMPYHDIPHLLWPVITDPKMASMMLEKLVVIMEQRYDKFSEVGVKHIIGYNQYVDFHNSENPQDPLDKMPYIVVVIDELSDLMQTASKEVQGSIQRISQLARASGIHLVIATQRPSVDVITGVIKSNLPSRIAFAVASQVDSKTILDTAGAENLLGYGDMLYSPQSEPNVSRLQGVFVTENEIESICNYAKKYASPKYDDTYYSILNNNSSSDSTSFKTCAANEVDPLYDEVVEFIKTSQKASSSALQTRFGIGFNRAARLINTLEDKGLIGPSNGSKSREVYIKEDE